MASVRVEQSSGGCVVVVSGDVDLTLAGDLEKALAQAGDASPSIVVDLAAATLLDSRTIGILLGWTERLQRVDGGLALVGANDDVRRLFATIGLEREFRFHANREDAFPKTP